MVDSVLCGGLLILILCRQSQSLCETFDKDLCIEETKKNWTEASESCNLAVSDTSLSVGVPITDIPVLIHRSSSTTYMSKDIHWIGATGTFTPWFELAGCSLYHYFPFNKQLMSSSKLGPIAQCHEICANWRNSYKEFGINTTHCVCTEDLRVQRDFTENKPCNSQNSRNFENDVIGTGSEQKSTGTYVFAWYRKVKVTTEIVFRRTFLFTDETLGECLLETNEGNKTYPCDSADITQRTWIQRHRNEINNSSLPRWTPYVRRLIISWRKDSSAEQNVSVCIGVRNQNGSYEPLPLRCSETHTSICKNADITTDTITPHTTSPGLRSSKEQTTFGHQVTGSSPVTRQKDNNETPVSSMPLIIGSVMGSLLCIIIVVTIIIVLFIKRRRPHRKEKSHPAPTENIYYSEMKEDRITHLVMVKEEPSPTINNTDYDTTFLVNKERITDDSEEYGKLLPNGEADVYNHTWDKPITGQLTDHVYSTTLSGNDANVYDHTDTNNAELTKVNDENRTISTRNDANLYDHTEAKYSDKIE